MDAAGLASKEPPALRAAGPAGSWGRPDRMAATDADPSGTTSADHHGESWRRHDGHRRESTVASRLGVGSRRCGRRCRGRRWGGGHGAGWRFRGRRAAPAN
jgi:hypothetical protein